MRKIPSQLMSRPACPDLEPECFTLPFCEAIRCAVEMRRGLTGILAHCPVSGVVSAAQYPGPKAA